MELQSTSKFTVLGIKGDGANPPASSKNKNATVVATKNQQQKPNKQKKQQEQQQGGKDKKKNPKQQPPKKEEVKEWTPEQQQKYESILSVGEECISAPELKTLLQTKPDSFYCYDGFEPSGRMHIAQGVYKAMNVNKCTRAGGTFVFWVADWFALMNDKMGGDLEKIKVVGEYLIEVWKASGMDFSTNRIVFKWASDEITSNAHVYWPKMLDIGRRFNVTRIKKCCQIMGRLEGSLSCAQVLYPLMQCCDVFFLKADICQLGVDQRKVNMLAREYCDFVPSIKHKPVILSHHMLYGLKAGQEKMSKSDPDSAIFMEDSAEDVARKIKNAYCPMKPANTAKVNNEEGKVEETAADAGKESMSLIVDELKNPCLDYIQHIIFSKPGVTFTCGKGVAHTSFESVKEAFIGCALSEDDLKTGLITSLNELLEPVRQHFENNSIAKELFNKVKEYKRNPTPPTNEFRKLDLVKSKMIESEGSHVVFVPPPTHKPTVSLVMDLLRQIHDVPADKKVVLWLSDWSAKVTSSCQADAKAIDAYYDVVLTCLRTLRGLNESDEKDNVQVVKQSDAILSDASNYWISVINVGRHFNLDEVMGNDMVDSDSVGIVIARLMKIADISSITPTSVSFNTQNSDDMVVAKLIGRYYAEIPFLSSLTPSLSIISKARSDISLHRRESEGLKTENDEYYLLDDPKVHGKSKMKKAFCEPGNIEYCPPIALVSEIMFVSPSSASGSSFTINRSDENGGNVAYKNRNAIETDFKGGQLHPGDLKAEAQKVMVDTLTRLQTSIKEDGKAFKGSKALKAFEKKLSKGKKK